MLVKQRHG